MSDEPADAPAEAGEVRPSAEEGAFVSRVRLIEERPLEDRAAAFAQLHDELARELEES